jgi:outer membrane protein TolC
MKAWQAALLTAVASMPGLARADVITLHELLGRSTAALDVLLAEAEHDSAFEDWQRARSEQGWRMSIAAGYGTERALIDEQRSRQFEATRTEVKLSYPLLGAYAKQDREIEVAGGILAQKKIARDTAVKIAQLEIEDVYAALWGAQEALEVIAAFMGTEKRYDASEDAVAYGRARAERRRLTRRRNEARARLEQLAGVQLPDLIARPVLLPKMPDLDVKRLDMDHPELATIRAQELATRKQLDSSVWYGIDGGFDLTQSTIQDQSGGQAGNGLAATFSVAFPLTFYQAGASERRKLLADIHGLELKLQEKRGSIISRAQEIQAEYMDLLDELDTTAQRTRLAGETLRREGSGPAPHRVRDYFTLALDEIDARTRYWRAHVEMRAYIPVGQADPAPEPPGPEAADVGTRLAEPLIRLLKRG